MDLLKRVERHLRRTRMSPTAFGREAAGDPNLVKQLRNGRRPGSQLRGRLDAYLDSAETDYWRQLWGRR